MNERIKELAEQNGFIHKWMPLGEQHDKLQSLEKFAELIVRECVDTVLDCSVEYTTRPQIASEIKQHFGVE